MALSSVDREKSYDSSNGKHATDSRCMKLKKIKIVNAILLSCSGANRLGIGLAGFDSILSGGFDRPLVRPLACSFAPLLVRSSARSLAR